MSIPIDFPDYPRDEYDEIPEPMCYDLLRIWPEVGFSYLWDMNGVSISLAAITEREDDEPLDLEFEQWQMIFEDKPLDEPMWESAHEQQRFDEAGAVLARKVFEFFGRTKSVIYYPTRGGELRMDAEGRPPIRVW